MALDLTGLKAEVFARGFSYLNDLGAGDARVTRWINDAIHVVDREENWLFNVQLTTGAIYPSLTLPRVLDVVGVANTVTNDPLTHTTREQIIASYGTTSGEPGTARYWYRTATGILGYPQDPSAPAHQVTWYASGPDLVAGADAPLMPDEYRMIIVELACRQAFRDTNAYEAAGDCATAANEILASMRANLLEAPEFVTRSVMAQDD